MIRNLFIFIYIFLITSVLESRNIGETEILTDDGIEVYQDEKYYILKKNVIITSDDFVLLGDSVKVDFDKDLYDIINIFAEGNASLNSETSGVKAKGITLNIKVKIEQIEVNGKNSELLLENIIMKSDGEIMVNNTTGEFKIFGENSNMITEDTNIEGMKITGLFAKDSEKKEVIKLDVFDEELSYVKNEDTDMYAKKIIYSKSKSIIELFENVKIVRGKEIVTGDYGTLDTADNSYKVSSDNSNNKVRVLIKNEDG